MAALCIIIGVVGAALAVIGIIETLYLMVAVGVVLIFAAFFLFARTNQGTAAPGKGNSSIPAG